MIRSVTILLAMLPSADVVFAQGTSNAEADREARLAFFKERAAEYHVVVGADRAARMTPQPVYRWSHPVGITADGGSFVWMDEERPVALGSVLVLRDGSYYGEFQSVTSERLKALRKGATVWEPSKPGCEFARVVNAPKPADTAAERLTQMKLLARRFSAELTKGPPTYSEGSIWRLRMLPKQLMRYGEPKAKAIDGALFAFCHDTDPEVILLLEANGEAGDVAWSFAFAPLCGWKATAKCDDKVVWSRPRLAATADPRQPYITFAEPRLQEASK